MQNQKLRWDFHVPLNCRMAEKKLSSDIHTYAIFQAWMWDFIEHINKKTIQGF